MDKKKMGDEDTPRAAKAVKGENPQVAAKMGWWGEGKGMYVISQSFLFQGMFSFWLLLFLCVRTCFSALHTWFLILVYFPWSDTSVVITIHSCCHVTRTGTPSYSLGFHSVLSGCWRHLSLADNQTEIRRLKKMFSVKSEVTFSMPFKALVGLQSPPGAQRQPPLWAELSSPPEGCHKGGLSLKETWSMDKWIHGYKVGRHGDPLVFRDITGLQFFQITRKTTHNHSQIFST